MNNFTKYALTSLVAGGLATAVTYHMLKDDIQNAQDSLTLTQKVLDSERTAHALQTTNNQTAAWKDAFLAPADSIDVITFNYAGGSAENSAEIGLNVESCAPCTYNGVIRAATIAQDNAKVTGKITLNYNTLGKNN